MAKPTLKEAEVLIANSVKPGFRKANKKQLAEAKEVVKADRTKRAEEFLAEYKEVCKKHRIEIKPQLEQVEGMPAVKAGVYLDEWVEKKAPEMKPWSEAMAENLDARSVCTHKEHAEGNICEKCGTALANWDKSGQGITSEYRKESLARIETEKKKEEAEDTAENTATDTDN